SIVIGQYVMDENNNKDIDRLLSGISLRTCSLDHWNNVLKKILKYYRENNKKLLVPEMADFYFDKRKDEYVHVAKAYKELKSILKDEGRDVTQISFNDFAPRLLKYHFTFMENTYSKLSKKQLKERVLFLEPAMEEILGTLGFLTGYKLSYVVGEDPVKLEKHYIIKSYMGASFKDIMVQSIRTAKDLDKNKLYLCSLNKLIPTVSLYPFFLMEYCPLCSSGQIFFLKENKNGVVHYISSQCGHDFVPKSYIEDLHGSLPCLEEDLKEIPVSTKKSSEGKTRDPDMASGESIYETALEIALSDGPLSEQEIEKLDLYKNKFNITGEKAQEIFKSVEARLFETVEVKEGYLEQIRVVPLDIPKELVYKQYPYPVANAYWQINQQSSGDPRNILLSVCRLMETVIRFFSSIVVAQYIRDTVDDLNVNLNLEKLVEPGIEEWLLFLEDILKLYNKKGEKLLVNELYNFYFSPFPELKAPLKAYKAICEDDFFLFKGNILKDELTPSEFFALLPDFIDAVENHGEDLSINQIKDLLLLFIPVVDNIISSLKFLIAYKLFYVKKAAYEKGKVRHEIVDCVGALSLEETEYYSENYFAQEKVYMSSTVDKNFPVLNLSPFFIVREYQKGFGNQFFFYWRVTGDGSLEYSNYQGDVRFTSHDYAKDLIKSFRKFTSEKKVNLVIKLLDWQKEKRKKDIKKGIRQIPQRGIVQEKNEQKKIQEDAKKAGETKKYARNSYRYALEACWSDGLLGEDERVYLDELKRILELSPSDVNVIEDSTRVKFAEKIDRTKPVSRDKNELAESLDFLEEEHQLLLKSLEERRQQIRTLERKNKSLEHERDILKESSEKLETEMVEKDKENVKLKKSFKELKIKLDSMARRTNIEKSDEIELLNNRISELEDIREAGEKKNQKLTEELSSFKSKNSLLEAQLEEIEEKLKETQSNSISYMEKLGELETDKAEEIEHLKKELKELQKKNNSLARLAQELTKKNEENKKLLQKLDDFDLISQDIDRLQQVNKDKEKKLLKLEAELEDLRKNKKYVEESNEEKEHEIGEIKKQLKDLMKSKNELEKNLATSVKNKDALVKLVQELKSKLDEAKKFIEKARDVDVIKSKLEDLEALNRELLTKKEKRDHEYISLSHEFERLNAEHVSVTGELDDYKSRLADMEEHNRELIALKEARDREYMELINELDRVSSESLSMRKDVQANKEEGETLLNLVNELREKLVHSDKVTGDLQTRLERLEKEKTELLGSNDKQSQKIRQLVSVLNELREEKKILQTNVAEINKEKISLEDKLERILKEFSGAKQFINQAKIKLADYENLQNELTALKAEHELCLSEKASGEQEKRSQKLIDALLQIEQLGLKVSELEKEKEEFLLMKDSLEKQLLETEGMLQSKSGSEDKDKLVQRLRDIDREKQELVRNNEKQKNTIIDLIKKTNSLNEENKKVTLSIQSLEIEKEELIRLNQELQEKSTGAEFDMASFDAELLEIKQRNNNLMDSLEQSNNRIKELESQNKDLLSIQEKLTDLQKEKETYENELNRTSDELEKTRNTVRELTEKMSDLEGIAEQTGNEEIETLRKDVLTGKEEIKSLEHEKNTYLKEKAKILLLLKGLKSKLSGKDKELEEMRSKAGNMTDDIKQKIEILEQEKEAFEELKIEKDRLINELETELQKLKASLQEKEMNDALNKSEKEAFEGLKNEKDRLISELEGEVQKLKISLHEKELDDTLKQKIEMLEKEREVFEDLKREKDTIINELSSEIQKLKTSLHEREIDDSLRQKIEMLEKEREIFEDLKREKDIIINDLSSELQKLRISIQEKGMDLKGKEDMEFISLEKQKITEAWDELRRAEENNMAELEEEWEKLSQNREEVEAQRASLEKDRELLNAIDIDTLEAEKRELESAWIELAEEREHLKSFMMEIEKRKDEQNTENNLLDTIRNKDQQIAILKEELESSLIELEEQRKFI
ncbi:MAG: hypothetical protein ABRQ38_18940, partial [Candidatus Eremiobacterota bacterium]